MEFSLVVPSYFVADETIIKQQLANPCWRKFVAALKRIHRWIFSLILIQLLDAVFRNIFVFVVRLLLHIYHFQGFSDYIYANAAENTRKAQIRSWTRIWKNKKCRSLCICGGKYIQYKSSQALYDDLLCPTLTTHRTNLMTVGTIVCYETMDQALWLMIAGWLDPLLCCAD